MRNYRRLGIKEARKKFSELILQAETGKTIEVTRHGVPVAKIVPAQPSKSKSQQTDLFSKNLELIQLSKSYMRKDGRDTISYLRDIDQL